MPTYEEGKIISSEIEEEGSISYIDIPQYQEVQVDVEEDEIPF